MKHGGTDTLTFVFGGVISGVAYLIGGIDHLAIALGIFMVCDYLTGILAAGNQNKISSKRAYSGLAKKTGMLVAVIVANQLDIVTGNTQNFMRNIMLMFLIGAEGISITENLGALGLNIPDFIKQTFEKFKGNKKEE